MKWAAFINTVQKAMLFNGTPRAMVIHLGGNDLDTASLYKLRRVIGNGIKYFHDLYPHAHIIWCDIMQRRSWRGTGPNINVIMDRKRKRVNGFGKRAVLSTGIGSTLTVPIEFSEPGFFRKDGVHLSDVGNEMFLDALRDCVSTHVR